MKGGLAYAKTMTIWLWLLLDKNKHYSQNPSQDLHQPSIVLNVRVHLVLLLGVGWVVQHAPFLSLGYNSLYFAELISQTLTPLVLAYKVQHLYHYLIARNSNLTPFCPVLWNKCSFMLSAPSQLQFAPFQMRSLQKPQSHYVHTHIDTN